MHLVRSWVVLILCGVAVAAAAESFRAAGTEFDAQRSVVIEGKAPPVAVVEFLHHGEIAPEGCNVAVVAKNHDLAPVRVLQVGPGDFCRLAFETIGHETHYTILYGGGPPAAERLPAWTHRDGLLLETRRLVPCNLRSFEAVRRAFESAKPLGAGYVPTVQHASNPFRLAPGPFMSRYHGRLWIDKAGEYTFWTSSQDCSFLVIDGRLVVEAPGRHWPVGQARPGSGKTIHLAAGSHEFEYYHVATGNSTMMVAAWAPGRADKTTRPALIPREAFRAGSIGREVAGPPSARVTRLMPDFTFAIAGDVPLPERPRALVGVTFRDRSPKNLVYGTSARWDFGDGQTSDEPSPTHVFLKPGLYQITLSRRRGATVTSISNVIEVDRPLRTWRSKEKTPTLDDYLPVLAGYDPKTLDAAALGQLVAAYLWKADAVAANLEKEKQAAANEPAAEPKAKTNRRRQPPKPKRKGSTKAADATNGVREYQAKAVEAVRAALVDGSAAKGDDALLELARTVTPVARFDLGDSPLALGIWEDAAARVGDGRRRAECEIAAADIAVNDLLDASRGRTLLEAATKDLSGQKGAPASRLQRIWGDGHALAGDGPAAQKAYAEAERLLGTRRSQADATARRGARSRSTEAFLRDGQWARAARELDQWQDEFPMDKMGGTLSLLYARYWAGREKHAQAVAVAEGLVAVNPDSPYADQLLYLAAVCESKQGRPARAVALLGQLLKDYPGSPLVPEVKRRLGKE